MPTLRHERDGINGTAGYDDIDGQAQRTISMRDRLSADEPDERARNRLIANLIGSSRLTDLHQGSITLDSRENEGSRFTLR